MGVGTSGAGPPGPEYRGTTGYVLRRRERSWLGAIIFVYAFPGSLLTLVTIGYAHGYPSVAEVIYFGLFFLLALPCGFWMWKERAAVVGQVLVAVDEGGIYLAGPPRQIPWREAAGLVAFRSWQDGDDGDAGKWLSRLVVVRPGQDCLPGAAALRVSSPDRWGPVAELHDEKLRLGELATAVHTYAPGLPVWDAGQVRNPGGVRSAGGVE